MECEKYNNIVNEIKDLIIRMHGSLIKQCHNAIYYLYKYKVIGVPLSIYVYFKDYVNHVVFVTHDLCVLDITASQFGIPEIYSIEDLTKYYKILAFSLPSPTFYGGPRTVLELTLQDYLKEYLISKGLTYKEI